MENENTKISSKTERQAENPDQAKDQDDLEADKLQDQKSRLDASEYDPELRYIERRRRQEALNTRRLVLAIILLFLSALLTLSGIYGLRAVFVARWPALIGVALGVAAALVATVSSSSSSSFLDVDRWRRVSKPLNPAAAWPFPTGSRLDDEEADDDDGEGRRLSQEKSTRPRLENDPFGYYFLDLKNVLQEKADDADTKASILLDRGTGYTKLGIWFFGVSIIAWQAMSWLHGFQTVYIYGIASCSGLFIFIEFISAWFLKQYRQYVDTSTYLLRVKAIFDRYMLVYLATRAESTAVTEDQQRRSEMLIELLSREITWPESYLQKKQDAGFAKDAMEAITLLTREIRDRNEATSRKASRSRPTQRT